MSFYEVYLGVLVVALVGSILYRGVGNMFFSGGSGATPGFLSFQRSFLLVYLVMMAADWMQGPYVYRLYSYYGFSRQDNGILFIAGFGASLVFGTWAGPFADRYGRKNACILYGITYALSCMTKHVPDFSVLMVGRLLGGVATSILWSAFESWMVSEHISRGFDPSLIGQTFSLMITLNGLVAIGSGFVAQYAVDLVNHPVAPFDVSALFLVIGTIIVWSTWSENYGDQRTDMVAQMKASIEKVRTDSRIVYTGLQQSLFEGAMYMFVFMWTPTLEVEGGAPIPHGLIFACFMIASSLGGALFGILSGQGMSTVSLTRYIYMTAAASMSIPVVSEWKALIMGGFLVFEVMVGLFWPSIGTLRSQFIPEENRATITNIFRIPLNAIVCLILAMQGYLDVSSVFVMCTLLHLVAVFAAAALETAVKNAPLEKSDETA